MFHSQLMTSGCGLFASFEPTAHYRTSVIVCGATLNFDLIVPAIPPTKAKVVGVKIMEGPMFSRKNKKSFFCSREVVEWSATLKKCNGNT